VDRVETQVQVVQVEQVQQHQLMQVQQLLLVVEAVEKEIVVLMDQQVQVEQVVVELDL
tara:strand:+ start:313 stop:486 length:174 start_codon:yes stop_codon:yes gene_type:complete